MNEPIDLEKQLEELLTHLLELDKKMRTMGELLLKFRWISVKDQMPPEDEWVYLASASFQLTTWGIVMEGKFCNPDQNYCEIDAITHWMPLPGPPHE